MHMDFLSKVLLRHTNPDIFFVSEALWAPLFPWQAVVDPLFSAFAQERAGHLMPEERSQRWNFQVQGVEPQFI